MRKLTTLLFALCFGAIAYAQETSIGLKAGVNFATLNYSSDGFDVSPGMRTSLHVGAVGEFLFNDNAGIQVELLYSGQGASFDFMGFESSTKLNYLDIPILFKYYFGDSVFNVQVGPEVGFSEFASHASASSIRRQPLAKTEVG